MTYSNNIKYNKTSPDQDREQIKVCAFNRHIHYIIFFTIRSWLRINKYSVLPVFFIKTTIKILKNLLLMIYLL